MSQDLLTLLPALRKMGQKPTPDDPPQPSDGFGFEDYPTYSDPQRGPLTGKQKAMGVAMTLLGGLKGFERNRKGRLVWNPAAGVAGLGEGAMTGFKAMPDQSYREQIQDSRDANAIARQGIGDRNQLRADRLNLGFKMRDEDRQAANDRADAEGIQRIGTPGPIEGTYWSSPQTISMRSSRSPARPYTEDFGDEELMFEQDPVTGKWAITDRTKKPQRDAGDPGVRWVGGQAFVPDPSSPDGWRRAESLDASPEDRPVYTPYQVEEEIDQISAQLSKERMDRKAAEIRGEDDLLPFYDDRIKYLEDRYNAFAKMRSRPKGPSVMPDSSITMPDSAVARPDATLPGSTPGRPAPNNKAIGFIAGRS